MKKLLVVVTLITSAAALSLSAADVKEIWKNQCVKCHGEDGKGETKMGKKTEVKDMTDPKVQADMKDDKMFDAIKNGIKDGDKTRMKAVEGLSDDDIKALVAYCRTFKK